MFDYFIDRPASLKNNILSGITVAISIIPEAIIFSYLAGVPPLTGIYSAILLTAISSLIGGRPGMISGVTSATAIIMVKLVGDYGAPYLFAAVLLAGVLQTIVGIFKLGKFIRLLPRPVVLGYVSGMAITILFTQLDLFKVDVGAGIQQWIHGTPLIIMVVLVGISMLITMYFPRVTKKIPSSLVAMAFVTGLSLLFQIDTPTISDFVLSNGGQQFSATAPTIQLFDIDFHVFETYQAIIPSAVMLAIIGLTQSLMTVNFIDELTHTRGNANSESLALGLGNMISGLLGGIGGAGMLGQSVVNVKSGAHGRASGITVSITLVLILVFGGNLIGHIPLAGIIGVMFTMVIGTFAWSSLSILNKIKRSDAFILIFVSAMTIAFNEAWGVLLGVIMAALVFAWDNALKIRVRKKIDENGTKHYEIYGPLFFGSTSLFLSKFDPALDGDNNEIVLNFMESRVWDHSGIEAIYQVAKEYSENGKQVNIIHLSRDSRLILKKVGVPENVAIIEDLEDPHYGVATNYPNEL